MSKKPESLPMTLVRHPYIWSGVGLLVRYGDDYTTSATFWKLLGLASVMYGVGSAYSSHQATRD